MSTTDHDVVRRTLGQLGMELDERDVIAVVAASKAGTATTLRGLPLDGVEPEVTFDPRWRA